MKIGVIVDDLKLARWQADALRTIAAGNEFIIYNCRTRVPEQRRAAHSLYYLLNVATVRNALTRRGPLPDQLSIAAFRDFAADSLGMWQALPAELLETMRADAPAVIVKFGMGLLRIPPPDQLAAPIISYHHGNPARFRGRPAAFYELLHGERTVGQVVQILNNSVDLGLMVASAETRALSHSYRATLIEAYRHSPLLLKTAIANAANGTASPVAQGPNRRLPGNWTVLSFVWKTLIALAKHWTYGAFLEKEWKVALSPLRFSPETVIPLPSEPEFWTTFTKPRGFRFLADPFPHPAGDGILAEGLRSSTGLGEILHICSRGATPLRQQGGHFSYPAPFAFEGETYLLSEIAAWTGPHIYRLNGEFLELVGPLRIAGSPRLLDPTLHADQGTVYLFANEAAEGSSVLRLWTSANLFGLFNEHPASPIRISPAGSRMGGLILEFHGARFRIGQDLRGHYGDGILVFRIEQLTPADFREAEAGEFRFMCHNGPHTFNLGDDAILFDYYSHRFSVMAGAHRLQSILRKMSSRKGRTDTAANISRAPQN